MVSAGSIGFYHTYKQESRVPSRFSSLTDTSGLQNELVNRLLGLSGARSASSANYARTHIDPAFSRCPSLFAFNIFIDPSRALLNAFSRPCPDNP